MPATKKRKVKPTAKANMIFWPCGICRKNCKIASICCDNCDTWCHLRCEELELADFEMFLTDKNVNYSCKGCFSHDQSDEYTYTSALLRLTEIIDNMKVAIIGAGASGIAAIKCCVDEGLRPTCYERTHDIGGLWRYTDEVTEGQACVMKSTIINTSKEMMCYSDFPIPAEYPIFMHNSYVQKYFNLYVDKFELRKHIHFRHEIISVKPTDDFETSGQWILKVKDLANEEEHNITYDAVMICTGHHAEKNMPDFPGLKNFKGKVLHSHDYKHTAGYEEKRVVVVGIGNSGGDAAVELSRVASQTFLSTRSGSWVYNRISDRGLPLDMLYTRRITFALKNIIGGPIIERLAQKKLEQRFDHSIYGLKPNHGILAQHPMVNDELPNRLASGTLKLKPNIKHLTESGVVFKDGTTEDDIDVVMFATGYVFGFPFLDESVVKVVQNKMELYKYIHCKNGV